MAVARPQSSERLQAYSDAVYAIVVTIMIIPLSQSITDLDPNEELLKVFDDLVIKFILYMISFLIIYSLWEGHVWVFQCIEYVGDLVVLVNLIMLLVVTFLPYIMTLFSEHIHNKFSVLFLCAALAVLVILLFFIVLLTYCKPKMIKEEIRESGELPFLRGSIFFTLFIKLLLTAGAAGCSFVYMYASWGFLIAFAFSNGIAGFFGAAYKQLTANEEDHHGTCCKYMTHKILGEKLIKNRVEAFSDGVFSIVGTLIILDICTEMFPSTEQRTAAESLADAMWKESTLILIYTATFLTVGMLWFIHHSVFQFVSRVPRFMSFFNKWSLLFIGLMPFGFRLLKVYSIDTEYEKESHVIQVNCVIIFCASMSQLFMWLSVHWKRDKHLLAHHKGLNYGITLCKLLVYPIISAILFGFAFSSIKITIEYVAIIQLGVLVIHFLIKIVYEIIFKCCVGDIQSDNEDTSEIDDELMALDSLPRIASKSKRTETLKAGVFLNNSTDDTHM